MLKEDPVPFFHADGRISFVQVSPDTAAGVDTLRRVDLTLGGSKAQYPDPVAMVPRGHHANFYLPQCGPSGAAGVQPFGRLRYPGIYPQIDLHVYSGLNGQKLTLEVKPGGNVADMELHFQGQDTMLTDGSGNLVVMVDGQAFMLPAPYSYQTDSLTILPVGWTASYQVNAGTGTVTFSVGAYDASKPLVILLGPAAMPNCCWYTTGLCWSTFYGGSNVDYPKDMKDDAEGNIYVTGRTESTWTTFPHLEGAINATQGQSLATLTKFDPDHVLKWTVFHGGATAGDRSHGSAVAVKNAWDQVYMVGATDANDFFTQSLAGAFNLNPNNGQNYKGYIARFKTTDGTMQWSTILGQNMQVQAIDVDPEDNQVLVSGITGPNLPLGNFRPPANGYNFAAFHGGFGDAFVALFNASEAVIWSAFYGGGKRESLALARFSLSGAAVMLAGNTESNNLPLIGSGGAYVQPGLDTTDVFILEADKDLAGDINWATYLGGMGVDALGPQGMSNPRDLYLTGTCGTLPLTVNGPGWYDATPAGPGLINGFIARFNSTSHIASWITYLGDGAVGQHAPYCISVVPMGDVPILVGGYTADANFPTFNVNGLYNQAAIVQDALGTKDGFLIRFNNAQQLQWGSYFGGRGGIMNQPENVTSVLLQGSKMYASGYCSQNVGVEPNHIPLDGNAYSTMFFNPDYNYDGTTANFSDGFVTLICNELTAGPEKTLPQQQVGQAADGMRLHWSGSGELVLMDLSDGPHHLAIYDAQGRVVLERKVSSTAGRSEAVLFTEHSAALYVVVVDQARTGKLVPIR
jgi:hypothetical protein